MQIDTWKPHDYQNHTEQHHSRPKTWKTTKHDVVAMSFSEYCELISIYPVYNQYRSWLDKDARSIGCISD